MQIRSRDLYTVCDRLNGLRTTTCKPGSPTGQASLDRLWKRAKEQSGIPNVLLYIFAKFTVTFFAATIIV